MKILRGIIYSVVALLVISLIFIAFNMGIYYLIDGLAYLELKLSKLFFWVLFFIIGTTLISVVWTLFKYLAVVFISIIAQLAPSKIFAAWAVLIISFFNALYCIVSFWYNNGFPNLVIGLTGVVVSIMALSLANVLTNVTHRVVKSYEPVSVPADMFDRMEMLDKLTENEFKPQYLEVMRGVYNEPDMSIDRAKDLFNQLKEKMHGQ